MMKRIGYWLLLLCLVMACVPELPVQPEPAPEPYPEGAKVTVQFSVSNTGSMPAATKALGEKPELDSLFLAVFGSSGYLKEYVKAEIIHKPDYSPMDTVMTFKATLTLSDKERSIHFIGNGPSTLDFGYDYEILPQLLSAEGGQAFWQMKKDVLIQGVKQPDGSYLPTDATNAQFQDIPLIRNFAKIVLLNDTASNFTPDYFAVFSVPSKGSVVPFSGGKFVENYQDYSFPGLTDTLGYVGNLPDSTDIIGIPDEWETRKASADAAVYLYERSLPSDQFPPTYVIVHGIYNNPKDPDSAAHNNKPYFYKIDLMQDGAYYPIVRNFKYQINIRKILSIGHTSAQAAAASAGSADVSADITTSHLNDISDGEARLVVQPWMSRTFNKRQVNNNVLHVKFFDDVMSGEPNMNFNAVSCEIRPILGGENIIESVSIGHPVQATGTEKGWRTVTFTTKEPGAPGTPSQTQAIRISGTYKTDYGESRTLYRDVLITLQPLQQFQLSVESPDDEGQGVPRDTAKTVRLYVNIPTNLVESMFPLNFTIEPEDMSLTPDNHVSNNNLPVSAATSISDHAGYSGKRAFQFQRSLTYDEYLALPQSLDPDGEPIRTLICHFKTTRKDNATTIWVANEYFSKSYVSYKNPPIRNLRYFYVEARDENIDQSIVKLQFSGKVEYLKNEDGWVTYTSGSEIRMKNGDRIYFRGNVSNWSGADHFAVQGRVNLGGNIASLFRNNFSEDDLPDDWGTDTGSTSWSFKSFFRDESGVIDASALVLPMTSIRNEGYREMFMGCSNLIAAPALPATNLANNCYQDMFSGCTSLTTAPKLLAETLPQYCYYRMFSGCPRLNEITMTARTIGNNSLTNWVNGVAATGDFYGYVEKPALPSGNNGIPTGWVDRNEFYVTAVADGVLSFDGSGLQYSRNWDDWTSDGIGSISVAAGDIVRFRGVRNGGSITSTAAFNVAGNILSLAADDYTTISSGTFAGAFKNAATLESAAKLVLPTTLQPGCFKELFSGCTALTTPPVLSATTLARNCYEAMFQGCTSLMTSPKLPATILVDNCYKQMFSGCTSLNFVILSATGDVSAGNYTENWLENVADSGFMLKSSDLVLSDHSSSGIPVGWSPDAPFFFEARTECTVSIKKEGLEYKIDGAPWQDYVKDDPISLSAGQKMFLRAVIDNWSDKPVSISGSFAIGGSIASLIKGNYVNRDEAVNATGWTFKEFMSGKTKLVDATMLELPMATVGANAYQGFFSGCTDLVAGPEKIAATTIGKQGAYQMFYGCNKITVAPAFAPTTRFGQEACSMMFYNCSALLTIPSFTSTMTLEGTSIFYQMFQNCTSLTQLTEPLFSEDVSLTKACFQDMFAHCTNLSVVPDAFLPATALAEDCYRGMFQYTALVRAPFLLVETLSWANCYRYMFYGCKSLSYIKCLASNPSSTYTQNFTGGGVAASGVFIRNENANWPVGVNGIPNGWTVKIPSEE